MLRRQNHELSAGSDELRPAAVGLVSVVIPAWNEEDGIAEIVGRVQTAAAGLQGLGLSGPEIVIVDDGSIDRTAEIVQNLSGVRLIRHESNRGYGAAIKTGFCHARGELLAFLDADGTYPPEHLPELCEVALMRGADVVVGSRRSGETSQMPAVRRLGNFIWSGLVSTLGGARCADPASGMRLLRRSALPLLYPLPDGLNFTPVMSTRALHEELRVVEIPIPYAERVGRSKLSVVRDGLRFLKTIMWTALEYNPAKVLGLLGTTMLATALAVGIGVLTLRAAGVTTLDVWGAFSVYATLVCSVVGLSMYSLGVTFNHVIARFLGHQKMRRGLFQRIPLEAWIESGFGWAGSLSLSVGLVMTTISITVGADHWEMTRVWLWLLGSALFLLIGVQLVLLWMVGRIMDRLAGRPEMIDEDLNGIAQEDRVKAFSATT